MSMGTMSTERMGVMGMPMPSGSSMGMMSPMSMGSPMMSGMMGGQSMMSPGMGVGASSMGMMLPRCTIKMEKIEGGMRCSCTCDDRTAAMMLQQLCMMNANGMMGCCMMMNGMMVCQCSMSMGTCRVEMTEMGCTMSCTSGDAMASKMVGACCDCMNSMMMPGCTCYMMLNGMPVCCCVC